MDTEKIVGDVAEVVRDLVSRTLKEAEERAEQIIAAAENEAKSVLDRAHDEAAEIRAQGRERRRHPAERDSGGARRGPGEDRRQRRGPDQSGPRAGARAPVVPEPTPPPPDPAPSPEPAPEPEPPLIPEPTPPPDEATPPQVSAAAANGKSNDDASARLVAMNLALEGATREQAKEQIEAEYECDDLDGLIDDIFARVPAKG